MQRGRRALVLGAGGAALAVVEALERAGAEVTTASRREPGWPPSAAEFEVLVNATPVKEELIVVPHADLQIVDLAYLAGRSRHRPRGSGEGRRL